MEKASLIIIQNLGYTDDLIASLTKETKANGVLTKKAFKILQDLGTPDTALHQIKKIEDQAKKKKQVKEEQSSKNKELIETLIRKCRRSLDAFARKGVMGKIVFRKNKPWVIEAPEYHPSIQHLHDVCKKHFDAFSGDGVSVTLLFNGSPDWLVITRRKSDQPDI